MSDALAWLGPILTRKRADGSFYYSNEDVARFVPVFLLTMGADLRTLPPNIAAVVNDFAVDAGVKRGMTKAQAQAAMQAFLAANPLNPELVFEMKRGLREARSTGGSIEDRGRAAAKLIGSAMSARIAALPPGAVKGGPLARFALTKK